MAKRLLILENGKVYEGSGFGSQESRIGEVVFNTSMIGYQEILSDPTYYGKIVVMGYPLIGNYGITDDDNEGRDQYINGLVVSEYNDAPSNFRFTKTLNETLESSDVPGIARIDTREIIKILRETKKPFKAMITTDTNVDITEALEQIKNYKITENITSELSCKKAWYARTRNAKRTVVAIDCGIKASLFRELNKAGCNVVVVPYDTAYEEIIKYKPDGILLTNGPDNPDNLKNIVETAVKFKGNIPILGVGLGFCLVCLAYGAKIEKVPVPIGASNIPVMQKDTQKISIVTENQMYRVVDGTLKSSSLVPLYTSLIDGETQGVIDEKNMIIATQFAPQFSANAEGYSLNMFMKFMDIKMSERYENANKF